MRRGVEGQVGGPYEGRVWDGRRWTSQHEDPTEDSDDYERRSRKGARVAIALVLLAVLVPMTIFVLVPAARAKYRAAISDTHAKDACSLVAQYSQTYHCNLTYCDGEEQLADRALAEAKMSSNVDVRVAAELDVLGNEVNHLDKWCRGF
jgi:hypothetical protein